MGCTAPIGDYTGLNFGMQFMAPSLSNEALERLAALVAAETYLDVARWHLYVNDAKLDRAVAEVCYGLIAANNVTPATVADGLRQIEVTLGGGKTTLSLWDLVPATAIARLTDALQEFAE
ncbi:MAG: DUF3181 family protein [Oscillatoriales cyanobacterium SM2_1_8]|nr:DUF3181 family protein [Oscillatoriales cyanobacterium SM2_1_8]